MLHYGLSYNPGLLVLSPWAGAPIPGTHKKMTESVEQELREFMGLKHHSHGLKNQHFG
jgi:hypothetical protein